MSNVAWVTGAGKGIGEAIARALGAAGIKIAVSARTQTDIDRVAAAINDRGGEAFAVACDVTQPASVAEAVSRVGQTLGPITILVNNAGAADSHKFIGHDDALWRRMIDVNLNSVYYVTKAVVPMMVEAKWGRIINIASIASKVGAKYVAAYTASKHGVLGLTRALALEFVSNNITVNAVCPGYVDTPMTDRAVANITSRTKLAEADARAALEKTSPQNRLITPEEVAHVVMMLLDENARGITGQALNVDGGTVMY
ncbi:MAG TPA: SDR family NAD(P)-dependent oxidoreductase [Anaerolineales bacterium]|nr:SDR family NAD(P)-dependent oxidoreductase [Anaerolineales bacterium]